ncbi:hypothetical protein GCM10009123_03580 [Kangiella japonica]|uniref:Lipoprotein n=1 Tax=Kangiella japonica TaxID=647384 RepID=A0ABP3CDK2_9GAMM
MMKRFYLILNGLLALGLIGCSSDSERTAKEQSEPIKGSLQWCRMYHDPATSGERKPNAAKYCEPTLERQHPHKRDNTILDNGAKVEVKPSL